MTLEAYGASSLYVLAKRKYEKNYVKKIKTESGEVRVYDDAHVKKRWKKKVEHINALKKSLPKLQKKYRSDLKSDDEKVRALAAVVALLDLTAMRVGNDDSVDEFGTFGATTLKKKHVKISGNTVKFSFLGKKQVDQKFSFTDAAVAKVLKDLLKGKSNEDFVFEYEDGKRIRAKVVNRYLADFDITAKDLRGFHANRLMRDELKRTKDFDKALENVSESVGHESKTLMNQYLAPALVKKYKKAEFNLAEYVNSELAKIFRGSAPTVPHSHKPGPSEVDRPRPLQPGETLAGRQRITSPYGVRVDPITKKPGHFHKGVDLEAAEGTKILAFAKGRVIFAGAGNQASGNMVKVAHGPDDRLVTMYLHLSKILVSVGDIVQPGQVIGLAGQTGQVTGPHLHFIMKYDSKTIDPTPFLKDRIVVGA
jgi:murein DD-endopeptidase MepM/ murein hydrolase activator NlpD